MTEPTIDPISVVSVRRGGSLRRVLRNPLGVASVVILILLLLAAVLAPWIAPYPPDKIDIDQVLAPPSPAHWLGTDSAGRDVLSRLLYGGQATFVAAALATAVAVIIGVPAGLVAGYYTGPFDAIATWVANMLLSLPGIIILLAAAAAFGPNLWISMTILGLLLFPSLFRIVRTSVIAVRSELYVDAARVSGLSDGRIIGRHVLYVVRAPLIIMASLIAAITVGVQAGLSFLGIGDASFVSWGAMLSEGFRNIYLAPLLVVWPAVVISLVSGALALLGGAFRDALEDDAPTTPKRASRAEKPVPDRAATATAVPDAPADALLKVSGLTVEYPQPDGSASTVVNGVSFHVAAGEILGIVGESGSGKTQTAFSILGLLSSSAVISGGSIEFDGTELLGDSRSSRMIADFRGKRIGYVPQEPLSNLDPAYTVGYQLVRPMVKVLGIDKKAAKERALELLALVGIPSPERTFGAYPHEISGGMAQRVLIAGAVSCNPDLLIADEPTTALDVTVQAEVLDLLRNLQQNTGMSVVIVTHNFGVVADLCDRVVVMRKAEIVETGTARGILRNPQHAYTKALIASSLEGKTPRTKLLEASP
ncbi:MULTISPECIES: dipeptide/oligopeptide/nickel ABC transporter permease/ATP-binding protein [unclassified Leifsonia]|uniref:dipeptide/oligopeptide/nickel ABC transporter permease/ATP-binding protein n=1 Tax=unclassified Leifsonia TaxID=2663824 RepID=UPI0008A773C6|nr:MULTISPECIES: dipeptide/oligopeptide/nickel ABC transporter permease/ATP-binding protein [unclassified Leifsonia]SEI15143.1 ABC-type dipeptide/oligopeptide/nickel transport system, ATPase component [Leifsonia sp. CL154]SFM04190.1 ABC-type dipeptide/oligopeptide/nickel transport system, ATPase component [Leifsonia sp. CL147]